MNMKEGRRIPHPKFERAAQELSVKLFDAVGRYKGDPAEGIWELYEKEKDNFTTAEQVIMKQIIGRAVYLYQDLKNAADAFPGTGDMPDWFPDLEDFE